MIKNRANVLLNDFARKPTLMKTHIGWRTRNSHFSFQDDKIPGFEASTEHILKNIGRVLKENEIVKYKQYNIL